MEVFLNVSSSDKILFLGEGNFTFSTSLISQWQENLPTLPHVVSTCFEDRPVSKLASENIEKLRCMGVEVVLSVDATHCFSPKEQFSRVFFMFPHVGGKSKIHLNRDLIRKFSENITSRLKNQSSKVIVTLCAGQGGTGFDPVQRVSGDTWQIVPMMSFGNLQMVDVCTFEIKKFSDYKSFGYRGMNKGFHSETGIVHIFEPSAIPRDYFRIFDTCLTLEDLEEQYITKKIEKLKNREILLWKKFNELSIEITKLIPLAKICNEDFQKNYFLKSPFSHDQIKEIFESPNSKTSIKICFVKSFKLDFSKCPLQVLLVCGPISERESQILDQHIGHTVCELFSLDVSHCYVLVDLSAWILKETGQDSWQHMWADKNSLYPVSFTHDLAYTFTDDRMEITEDDLAIVLWTMGFDSVTGFNIFDVYKDKSDKISNTCRFSYKSYLYPTSSAHIWDIHYNKIGGTLSRLFQVQLR